MEKAGAEAPPPFPSHEAMNWRDDILFCPRCGNRLDTSEPVCHSCDWGDEPAADENLTTEVDVFPDYDDAQEEGRESDRS